jgi:hypothetical protein
MVGNKYSLIDELNESIFKGMLLMNAIISGDNSTFNEFGES